MKLYYNGNIITAEELMISSINRSFRYGDGCFESMVVFKGNAPYFKAHLARLWRTMKLLRMDLPTDWSLSFMEEQVDELLKANELLNARLRIQVNRAGGGLYTPLSNVPDLLITCAALDRSVFELNTSGLLADVATQRVVANDELTNLKTNNRLPYVLAALEQKENAWGAAILLNNKAFVADASSSNVFYVSADNKLFTPALAAGCLDGVMRKQIIRIARSEGLQVLEKEEIEISELLQANEFWLSNAVQGIQWVRRFREASYKQDLAMRMVQLLNEDAHHISS